ncbi:DAZAP2 family protein [Megaselia abdita]
MSDKKGSSQSYPTAPNGEDAFYQREAPPPYESLYPSLGAHAQPQPQHPQQQYYQTMQSAQPQALYYSHQPQQYYQQPQQYQYEYQPQQQYYVTQQFNPQPQTHYVEFDPQARFSGRAGGSMMVPPPPPGCMPLPAQMALMQGQNVRLECAKKKKSFF